MGRYDSMPLHITEEMLKDYRLGFEPGEAVARKVSECMASTTDQQMKRIEMSPQYPTIIHLNAIEPKDGDTLILSSERVMSPTEVQNIRNDFEHCLPNVKVIIVSGYGVDVMRSGKTEGSQQ